jgi:hypothetical protein
MLRNVLSLTAAGLFLALASACASNGAPAATAQPQAQPTPAPAQQQVASTAPAKKEFHPDDMVCRVYEVTGSHVAKQRICKTRAKWIEDARAAQEAMRTMQNGNSAQPGGEQLIPGGTPR